MKRWVVVGGVVAIGLCACRKESTDKAPTASQAASKPMSPAPAPAGAAPASARRSSVAALERNVREKEATGGDAWQRTRAGETVAEPTKPARKVIYTGALAVRGTDARALLTRAVALAEGVGGYVENLGATSVDLRVPAAKFRDTFTRLLELGPVLHRSISAEDVTKAYSAVELRIKILSASRARLQRLLAHAREVPTKLKLLGDIQRLTDEIDQLERQRHGLASLIQFARISLSITAPKTHVRSPGDEPIAAFRWLHALSPFKDDVARTGRKLKLAVPEGLVKLEHAVFKAESAEGTTLWAHKRDNEPRGDTAFWAAALRARLAASFTAIEPVALGAFEGVRVMHTREGTAYRYLVAVRADGDTLEVAEAQYPNEAQEKRHGDAVRAAISGGAR